jgi:hypothetical protein
MLSDIRKPRSRRRLAIAAALLCAVGGAHAAIPSVAGAQDPAGVPPAPAPGDTTQERYVGVLRPGDMLAIVVYR